MKLFCSALTKVLFGALLLCLLKVLLEKNFADNTFHPFDAPMTAKERAPAHRAADAVLT